MPFLDWVNKNQALVEAKQIPYHLLKSEALYGENSENLLIQGDNLLALKALRPLYEGQIKCIFIDPPYNTKSAFTHYDDKLEHSQWLSMMYPRLQLLRDLLTEDGVLFCTLDDSELAYLTVMLDEIFGRKNNCGLLVWEKKKKPSFLNANMGGVTEYILAYAKDRSKSPAFVGGLTTEGKKYPLNNAGNGLRALLFPKGKIKFNCKDQTFIPQDMSEGNIKTKLLDTLVVENGVNKNEFRLEGEWRYSQDKLDEILRDNEEIVISKSPFRPNHIKAGGEPKKMKNLLSVAHYQMSTYEDATSESEALFGSAESFDYPKPEKLIYTLLNAVMDDGDIVLDSFLGSGTTAAVAQKMGHQWIGIEMGEQAKTHCVPRLEKVIAGEQGGISSMIEWTGGGGFHYCKLASPMFNENGQINEGVNFKNLAHFLWNYETKTPASKKYSTPLLGIHKGIAYYLLYNGILGDKTPDAGNVLTQKVLKIIDEIIPHDGPKVIYGEACRISQNRLDSALITFKQIPYDIHTI